MKDNKRELWIDGLKGICCLLIFVHHFICAFYPAEVFGPLYTSHTKYDSFLSQSILGVFFNGNFLVYVFCTISGYVVAKSFIKYKNKDLFNTILKRYLRLVLPVFLIGIFVFLLSNFNLFYNVEAASLSDSNIWLGSFYLEKINFISMINSAFFKTPFYSDTYLSNAFWMYGAFFMGSIYIYLICITLKNKNKLYNVFLIIPFIACYVSMSFIISFLIGYLLFVFTDSFKLENKKYMKFISFILIIVGLFFGGFPSEVTPDNYYSIFNFNYCFHPHFIGAALLVTGLYYSNIFKWILSLKPFQWLGKLSFSVYLIHIPIIYSFSSYLFLKLIDNNRYNFDCLIVFILSLIIVLISSFIFNIISNVFYKKVSNLLIKEEQK